MKLKMLIIPALCAVLLSGCANGIGVESPIIPEPSITESTSSQEDSPEDFIPADDTLPPKEGMVRSPLTNEWVTAETAGTRPIAVIIPNEASAIPHYNLSKASVLYEANVEERMTRMMAIFENWTDLDKIGNVRSLRTYYGYWSFEWDAFLVHYGGPFYVDDLVAFPDTQNLNGILSKESVGFYRTTDRKAPHNVYTSGARLLKIIQDKEYSTEYRNLADQSHYNFATPSSPNTLDQYGSEAKTATYIDMSGCYPLTRCYFRYDEEDGLYYRYQHLSGGTDGPHLDADGEQLTFKNILVQNTYCEELSDGYLVFQCHDTTRDGWYFTNGKGIHVNWEKTSDYGATRYYDDNGNEILLNTGKTMICIVEDGDTFSFR